MKTTALLLSVALLAGASVAQTLNNNIVQRENTNWLVISGTSHPTTLRAYNWPPVSPTQYVWTSGVTVPAGTLTARWIPSMVNLRREPRQVTGFRVCLYPAAATTAFPLNGYYPAIRIHVPKQSMGTPGQTWAQGAQYQPDMTAAPIHLEAQGTFTWPQFGAYIVTKTIMTPAIVNQTEIVLSAEWKGGENDSIAGQQSINGDYTAGISPITTICFVAPGPAFTITPYPVDGLNNFSHTYLTYMEDAPVINAQSDWGYRRNATLVPPPSGYNSATGLSDLASATGNVGWDVVGGASHGGEIAALLFNVGPVFPAAIPFLGVTLEVNPADPAFGLLAPFYNKILDAQGVGDLPYIPLPALGPSAIGTTFGAEYILLNATLTAFTGSTQSSWITVNR